MANKKNGGTAAVLENPPEEQVQAAQREQQAQAVEVLGQWNPPDPRLPYPG